MEGIHLDNFEMQNGHRKIFTGTNMTVPPGKYILKGPNGCGKSTFLRAICGLQDPSKGRVIREAPCYLVSDCIVFPGVMTIKTILTLHEYFWIIDSKLQERIIDSLGLEQYIYSSLNDLSQGTQQKVRLLLGLSIKDGWLLLDEPFNGLDEMSVNVLNEVLSRNERPMIIVDHSNQLELLKTKDIIINNLRLCINL